VPRQAGRLVAVPRQEARQVPQAEGTMRSHGRQRADDVPLREGSQEADQAQALLRRLGTSLAPIDVT